MLLILEGVDGSGKTTLAKELEARGFKYIHNGPPPEGKSLYQHYEDQILAAQGSDVCFDRLHVGELVYGPIMRGKSLISVEEMRILNRLIFAQGARLVFCDTDDSTIESNWLKRRGKEYVDDADKLWEVASQYRHLVNREFHPSSRITYDYRFQDLTRWLKRPGKVLPFPACPDGVWGSPTNTFLIVGERPGGKPGQNYDRAFCNLKGSSGYLNQCLWDAGYQEHELAFTNAYQLDGEPRDLTSIYRARPKQVFITLGAHAREACLSRGIPHLPAEHPSFVKRFKTDQRKKYAQQLKEFRRAVECG